MAGLTPKQEAFCQKYIETGNANEAYRQAYNASGMKPATINRKAHEIVHMPHIAARVDELREALREQHGVTVATLIAELEEARAVARQTGNASAMVSATMGKAKLAGLDKGGSDEDDAPPPVKVEVTVRSGRKRANTE